MGLDVLAPVEVKKLKGVGGFTLGHVDKVDNNKVFLANSKKSGFNFAPYVWKLETDVIYPGSNPVALSSIGYSEPRVLGNVIYWAHAGTGYNETWKYDLSTKTLTRLADDPFNQYIDYIGWSPVGWLHKSTCTLIGTNLHVYGGYVDNNEAGQTGRNPNYRLYNISTNVWTTTANGLYRDDACSWEYNGKIYIYGGWYPSAAYTSTVTNSIVEFHPNGQAQTNTWYPATLPAVYDSANTKANGEVYILGGALAANNNTNGFYKSTYLTSGTFATWIPLIKPPVPSLAEHCMATIGKYIYVFGGDVTDNFIFNKKLLRYNTDFDIYSEEQAVSDPTLRDDAWTFMSDSVFGMAEGGMVAATDPSDGVTKLYTVGGSGGYYEGHSSLTSIFVYNPEKDKTELLIERVY